jgi:hypothetical protein
MQIAFITGRLGADAELRHMPNGDAVLSFNVATSHKRKGEEQTTWRRCTMFGKRAEAVKAYLVKNFNLDTKRFVTVGKGSGNPVASNENEDGRALNRRTDIKVVLNAE